jgi:threonine synthase
MVQQTRFWLVCPACEQTWEPGPYWEGCPTCRDPAGFPHWLEVAYDMEAVPDDFAERPGRVWEYAALLPVRDAAAAPTLGEGNTPLLRVEALNRELGLPNLWLKLEGVNPTGAFKDRFHTVSLAVARELGFRRALVATAGNHGTSCAAYAARAGIPLLVILSPLSPPEQRRLMRLFGARVVVPRGSAPVMTMVRSLMEPLVREHAFYPSTVLGLMYGPANPYGVEGYKTIAYEIVGQLGGSAGPRRRSSPAPAPDRVCVPTAAGDALYGPYKGFRELQRLGRIDRLPRMTACQSAQANSLVQSVRQGLDHVATVPPTSLAISIGDPTAAQAALTAIRESDGDAWEATDAALLQTVALLGRHGICVEAGSAAAVAALRRAAEEGRLDRDERIVAVLTGTGMKWPAQLDAAIGPAAEPLPDDIAAVLAAFEAPQTRGRGEAYPQMPQMDAD